VFLPARSRHADFAKQTQFGCKSSFQLEMHAIADRPPGDDIQESSGIYSFLQFP
jgi:hypothetical protein